MCGVIAQRKKNVSSGKAVMFSLLIPLKALENSLEVVVQL
jgi:hypothetical protein